MLTPRPRYPVLTPIPTSPRAATAPSAALSHVAPPAALDWRDQGAVSPVKDQGICGSCWAFATAQTIESAKFLQTKSMVALSPQALVDCAWGNGNNGCDGGEAERAFEWILTNGGVPTEGIYGVYEMVDGLCHNNAHSEENVRIVNYTNVTSANADEVTAALTVHGPLSIAIDAGMQVSVLTLSGLRSHPLWPPFSPSLASVLTLSGLRSHPLWPPFSPSLVSVLTLCGLRSHPLCSPFSPSLVSVLTLSGLRSHPLWPPFSPSLASVLTLSGLRFHSLMFS